MAFQGGIDGTDPVRRVGDLAAEHEDRKATQGHLASGTLACPRCDAPVAPTADHLSPADSLGCPYCGHAAAVRDFLSLGQPTRPARVVVRVIRRRRAALR
jgi:DNA-directed RNA polymerase subunit RPC12/RpoP